MKSGKRYLAMLLVLSLSLSIAACGSKALEEAKENEEVDSVEETESTESTFVCALMPAASFISGQSGEIFEVKQTEVADGISVDYVEAEAFSKDIGAYRIDLIRSSKYGSVDLTGYDMKELALEFWMKSSDSRIISLNNSNILRIGTGEYIKVFNDGACYADFKGIVVIRLKADEWTKVTLPLQDATDVNNIMSTDSIEWARFLMQNLEEGVKICVSDLNIVKLNQ